MERMIIRARHSTAIHEAAHAVISYVLGRRVMFAVLLTDKWGETMPMCSVCDICLAYYGKNNPANNAHSKDIQNDLCCDMAIALAGEIAQRDICLNQDVDEREFERDRSLAREKASAIHFWSDCVCWRVKYEACQICQDYSDLMTQAVEKIVAQQHIKDAIHALAELLENRHDCERLKGSTIEEFLDKKGLTKGLERGALPPAPFIERINSMTWKKLILNDEQVTKMKHRYIVDRFMAEYRDLLGPKRFTLLLGKRIERRQMPVYVSPTAIPRCEALIESYPNEECAQPEASTIEECYGDCSGHNAQSQQTQ